jgi:peptide/nickel transport system substrate-binding protein
MKKCMNVLLTSTLMMLISVTGAFAAAPKAETPQYGGTFTFMEKYPVLNPQTWDNSAWLWKHPYDTGFYLEHLLIGDLQKGPRGTNQFDFKENAWFPHNVLRGELVEKYEIKKKPMQVIFHLRKGVMWQEKPGVMKAREFVADDVVFNMNRLINAPKAMKAYTEFIDRWEALDKHTVILHLKQWDADWRYKWAWGAYDAIQPKEMVDAPGGPNKWENACGTGPYMLTDYKDGHSQTYIKNRNYWDSELIGGKKYNLPFTDKIVMLIIKDEATQLASLRTGKADLMMTIDHKYLDELKKSIPQLKWSRNLWGGNQSIALRMDTKPFNDIRVRRALNLAVNKKEIIDNFYKGQAELHTYPFPANFKDIYTPLEKLSPAARELYSYNPEKAKKLLVEAGYPNGFSFKVPIPSNNQDFLDLTAMVVAYLAKVGVKMELEPMEYGPWMSVMMNKKHTSAIFLDAGHGSILAGIRKNFLTGQTWNPHLMSDPHVDKVWNTVNEDPNMTDAKAYAELKKLIVYIIEQAPAIILPQPYVYTAWWPWVKNYYGEQRVGLQRSGPIWARVWIDQEMKKKMGY